MKTAEAVARYAREGLNPFKKLYAEDRIKITAQVRADMAPTELERLAKEATPAGYRFVKVNITQKPSSRR